MVNNELSQLDYNLKCKHFFAFLSGQFGILRDLRPNPWSVPVKVRRARVVNFNKLNLFGRSCVRWLACVSVCIFIIHSGDLWGWIFLFRCKIKCIRTNIYGAQNETKWFVAKEAKRLTKMPIHHAMAATIKPMLGYKLGLKINAKGFQLAWHIYPMTEK